MEILSHGLRAAWKKVEEQLSGGPPVDGHEQLFIRGLAEKGLVDLQDPGQVAFLVSVGRNYPRRNTAPTGRRTGRPQSEKMAHLADFKLDVQRTHGLPPKAAKRMDRPRWKLTWREVAAGWDARCVRESWPKKWHYGESWNNIQRDFVRTEPIIAKASAQLRGLVAMLRRMAAEEGLALSRPKWTSLPASPPEHFPKEQRLSRKKSGARKPKGGRRG